MPVIYAPQGLPGHPASVIAEFCVKAAAHTKGVLESLNSLKRVAVAMASGTYNGKPIAQDATIDLGNVTPDGTPVNQFKIKPADLAALMKHIGYRNIPFSHSIAMLGIYENMFYPTDNTHSDDLLGYYRQREWRLVTSDIAIEGQKIVRPLTAEERKKLEAVDASFWCRELTFKGKTVGRSEFAQVYQIHGGLSPRDLIESIVVPESAEKAVRDFYDGELEVVNWEDDELASANSGSCSK